MKTCKWCKYGYNYCGPTGFCTYCYLSHYRYPVMKLQDDTCPNWYPDEDEEEEED